MKKVYTFLFLLLFVTAVQAQTRSNPQMEYVGISGGTYTIGASVDQNLILEQVPIRNTTSNTIYIKARVLDSTLVKQGNDGHTITLCFAGLCLRPDAVAPGGNGFQLDANTSTSIPNNLILELFPHGVSGTSTVTYRIFTTDFAGEADGVDSMDLVVNYAVGATARSVKHQQVNTMTKPYPNPATSISRLSYDIPNGSMGQLRVYDMLGKTMEIRTLHGGKGTETLRLKGYKNGIYFCSLSVDGVIKQTRKLIVSR